MAKDIRVFNWQTQRKEILKMNVPGKVGIYVCSFTGSGPSHIGDARTAVNFDVLHRYLKHLGYEVVYVKNCFEVEDEIISQTNKLQEDTSNSSTHFCQENINHMTDLQCLPPTHLPRVSDHMGQIQDRITQIIDNGYGYLVDGDVFFAGHKLEHATDGERASVDSRKQAGFTLWKSVKDGEPSWDSPWGPGRPGWHITCSAMSAHHLPFKCDIHAGGSDSIGPRHQTEMAALSSACQESTVNYWLQNGHLTVDNEKMSESLGNLITISGIIEWYHPLALRYFLLSAHYMSPINFSISHLEDSSSAIYSIYETLQDCEDALSPVKEGAEQSSTPVTILTPIIELQKELETHMSDDLDTSQILNGPFQGAMDLLKKSLEDLKNKQEELPALLYFSLEIVKEVKAVLDILGLLSSLSYSEVLRHMKDKTLKREEHSKEDVLSRIFDRAKLDGLTSKGMSPVEVRKERKEGMICTSGVRKASLVQQLKSPVLNNLPEEIFVNIISLLTVKDAARACFVSKRLKDLWMYSRNITFDHHLCHYSELDQGMKNEERENYVKWVSEVLNKHKGSKLDKFCIMFDLDDIYKVFVDGWVKLALDKKVETLVLNMFIPRNSTRTKNYSFPPLKVLNDNQIMGECLKVLVIENVDMDEEVLGYIVSHCNDLQELSVTAATTLNHIALVGSSIRLKSIVVKNCDNLKSIKISDMQLSFFHYEGRRIQLQLNRVPSLVKVSLCEYDMEFFGFAFEQLTCCLSQLRALVLDDSFVFLRDMHGVFDIPPLPNLDYMELKISVDDKNVLLQMARFLEASPQLQKLKLKLNFLLTQKHLWPAERRGHNNLKIVEIVGFAECTAATNIVTYILDNAVVLSKLVINPVLPWCELRSGVKPIEVVEMEEGGRRHALLLKELMPESVKFICL